MASIAYTKAQPRRGAGRAGFLGLGEQEVENLLPVGDEAEIARHIAVLGTEDDFLFSPQHCDVQVGMDEVGDPQLIVKGHPHILVAQKVTLFDSDTCRA